MSRWSRRVLCGVTVAAIASMGVLAITPIAWTLSGRPDESYPEITFIGIGLPSALVALAAFLIAGRMLVRQSRTRTYVLTAVCMLALANCVVLIAIVGLPESLVSWLPKFTLSALFFAWPSY